MYVSDYGYAASPENWQTILYNYDNDTNRNNNWMFMGLWEWTITCQSDGASALGLAFDVYNIGIVFDFANIGGVRPVFYLNSDVTYISGTGTQYDPFRIA